MVVVVVVSFIAPLSGFASFRPPYASSTVKSLRLGQTSTTPVEIGSSFYIVRLVDFKEGGLPPLNDEIKAQIREILTKQESAKRYRAFISELYMKYRVRRFDGNQ